MLRIGASSCLLGHRVRYDGAHRRHPGVAETLSRCFEVIVVCPEMEVGMGTPREAVDLVGDPRAPRMVGQGSGRDWSGIMRRHGRRRAAEMAQLGVCGFVLKKGSPSCGPDGVPVRAGRAETTGASGLDARPGASQDAASGLFAHALTDALPLLPVEAEDRLDDASLCANFIERVHAYREWRDFAASEPPLSRLKEFHASHKLTLLVHSERHMRRLGRLLAEAGRGDPAAVTAGYGKGFMAALKRPATRGTQTNALQHMAGFLSARLDRQARKRLTLLVHDYRLGRAPLSAPLALMRRHAAEHQVDYVLQQSFLNGPAEEDPSQTLE